MSYLVFTSFIISKTRFLRICCMSQKHVHQVLTSELVKVELSPSKKICFVCFNESPLKLMKNAFYSILKALFVLKTFNFLSSRFGHIEKTA